MGMQFHVKLSVTAGAALVSAVGLGLGIAGASCGTRPPAAAHATAQLKAPRLVTCTGHPVVEPVQYTMPCADGDAWVTGMHWTSWTARGARGAGTLVQDNCLPTCAAGTFVDLPAQVQLAGLAREAGAGDVFTRMVVQYLGAGGHPQSETFYLAT